MADASAQPKPSSSVKLVLLGEAAVGKSSLVMRFVNNDFQENKEPTIGGAPSEHALPVLPVLPALLCSALFCRAHGRCRC